MLGGSLTRYHTPTMHGNDLMQELVKLAGPGLVRSIGHGLQTYEKGASAAEALKSSGEMLKRGLKRKLPAAVSLAVKTKAKNTYKKETTPCQRHFRCVNHAAWTEITISCKTSTIGGTLPLPLSAWRNYY